MMEEKTRNGAIDFWRMIFCLMIVFFHGKWLVSADFVLFERGDIGVEFFFILSGFLMAASVGKEERIKGPSINLGTDTIRFLVKKIKTIFPYMLYALIVNLIIAEIIAKPNLFRLFSDIIYSLWEILLLREIGFRNEFWFLDVAWYISAMLIVMLIFYPLIRKNMNLFCKVIAPIISLFLFGYLSKTYGSVIVLDGWTGFFYNSLIRAAAEISLGCICYAVCRTLRKRSFTKLSKTLLAFLELFGYLVCIVGAQLGKASDFSFVMVLFLAVSITITFSEQSALSPLFKCKWLSYWGKISMLLYLNHGEATKILHNYKFTDSYWLTMVTYLCLCAAATLLCWVIVDGFKKLYKYNREKIKLLFIKAENT